MNHEFNESSFIQKLDALKRTMRLSDEQKQTMRSNLAAYADMHEVMRAPAARAVPSPFTRIFFSRSFAAFAAVLILLVTSGVGVTYAAGNALPGQPLYVVKVDVAEPIQGALITSPTAQAEWQNELAERRLSEATTLAADNDLASSTQTYLEQQAVVHINQSEADSSKLAAEGNTDGALAIRSDLEARLSAHARLLALLDTDLQAGGQNDASTTVEVALLLQNVSQDQTVVSMSREASEALLSSEVTASSTATSTGELALASSTPAERASIAFINSQTSDRQKEEVQLFLQSAIKLGLLPASTASSTASSTPRRHKGDGSGTSVTATSTADTSTSPAPPLTATSTPTVAPGL